MYVNRLQTYDSVRRLKAFPLLLCDALHKRPSVQPILIPGGEVEYLLITNQQCTYMQIILIMEYKNIKQLKLNYVFLNCLKFAVRIVS